MSADCGSLHFGITLRLVLETPHQATIVRLFGNAPQVIESAVPFRFLRNDF